MQQEATVKEAGILREEVVEAVMAAEEGRGRRQRGGGIWWEGLGLFRGRSSSWTKDEGISLGAAAARTFIKRGVG